MLVAQETRRECLGVFAGDMVQVVGLHVARCHAQTVVDGTEGVLIARHIGFVVGRLDF